MPVLCLCLHKSHAQGSEGGAREEPEREERTRALFSHGGGPQLPPAPAIIPPPTPPTTPVARCRWLCCHRPPPTAHRPGSLRSALAARRCPSPTPPAIMGKKGGTSWLTAVKRAFRSPSKDDSSSPTRKASRLREDADGDDDKVPLRLTHSLVSLCFSPPSHVSVRPSPRRESGSSVGDGCSVVRHPHPHPHPRHPRPRRQTTPTRTRGRRP